MHMKAISFMSLANGGSCQVFELVDHPKIIITRLKQTRKHNLVQTITVGLSEFKTLDEAICAVKDSNNVFLTKGLT